MNGAGIEIGPSGHALVERPEKQPSRETMPCPVAPADEELRDRPQGRQAPPAPTASPVPVGDRRRVGEQLEPRGEPQDRGTLAEEEPGAQKAMLLGE